MLYTTCGVLLARLRLSGGSSFGLSLGYTSIALGRSSHIKLYTIRHYRYSHSSCTETANWCDHSHANFLGLTNDFTQYCLPSDQIYEMVTQCECNYQSIGAKLA